MEQKITFTVEQASKFLFMLGEVPAKYSMHIIDFLQSIVAPQMEVLGLVNKKINNEPINTESNEKGVSNGESV